MKNNNEDASASTSLIYTDDYQLKYSGSVDGLVKVLEQKGYFVKDLNVIDCEKSKYYDKSDYYQIVLDTLVVIDWHPKTTLLDIHAYLFNDKGRKIRYIISESYLIEVIHTLVASADNIKDVPQKSQEEYFYDLWERFPSKSKQCYQYKAREAWLNKTPIKISAELIYQIIRKLENHKKSTQFNVKNGKYIPHATTWIDKKYWNIIDLPQAINNKQKEKK